MLKRVTRAFSPRHLLAKLLEERQLKEPCCRRVVVMSEILKRDVVRVCKYPESRIAVIRNGIDVERFHPRQREARREAVRHKHGIGQEVIILFMSHNFRLKGLGPLVRAVAGLSRGEQSVVKCLIVGRGRARPFELLASELGVRERFLFAGPTDRPEDYYAAADVLAHPTFYDSFGNVCLEAMATSLPVVTTAFCGASEIITSGQEGMIVQDPWNAEELANALRRYLDADERSRAGLAARRLAEKYDAERNCEEMLALFGAVIRERNSKGG
jgi:UDP-glucose:(heptosyl)LPS alpha-1,3-glucosyltransferase